MSHVTARMIIPVLNKKLRSSFCNINDDDDDDDDGMG